MIQHETQRAQLESEFQRQRADDAERRAARDRQYFEELAKIKADFFNSATHDLKNPLASIRLNADILRRKVDRSLVHYIDRIENQIQRMNRLITDLLDLAQLETGNAIRLEKASMLELIEMITQEFQVVAIARILRQRFAIRIPSGSCHCTLTKIICIVP